MSLWSKSSDGCLDDLNKILDCIKDDKQGEILQILTAIDINNQTILHRACSSENVETVNAILEFIKEELDDEKIVTILTKRNSNGQTPLHIAFWVGNIDVVEKILYTVKVLPNEKIVTILTARDVNGQTPIHMALSFSIIEKILVTFIDKPDIIVPILNTCDKNKTTPFFLINEKLNNNNTKGADSLRLVLNKMNTSTGIKKIKKAWLLLVLLGVSIFAFYYIYKSMTASLPREKKKKKKARLRVVCGK